MITQLNPPIPVRTPHGKGMAQLVIDYGMRVTLDYDERIVFNSA
jgi:hypothetical protein